MNLGKRTALGALLTTLAAPAALAEGRQIEEVIVTAERQEASIQDTSISITAFTGEFIDDFGIRNQEDLQNFVPATTIQPYDATGVRAWWVEKFPRPWRRPWRCHLYEWCLFGRLVDSYRSNLLGC